MTYRVFIKLNLKCCESYAMRFMLFVCICAAYAFDLQGTPAWVIASEKSVWMFVLGTERQKRKEIEERQEQEE